MDIVILMFTVTICLVLVISSTGVVVAEFHDPSADTTSAQSAVGGAVQVIIGAVLGYLLRGRKTDEKE